MYFQTFIAETKDSCRRNPRCFIWILDLINKISKYSELNRKKKYYNCEYKKDLYMLAEETIYGIYEFSEPGGRKNKHDSMRERHPIGAALVRKFSNFND